MGVYLGSPDAATWRDEADSDPDSLAARVETALASTGHPLGPFGREPFAFEEKFYRRGTGGFEDRARATFGSSGFVGDQAEVFVPVQLRGPITGTGLGIYQQTLVIAPSDLLLDQARQLAEQIGLPAQVPAGDNLEIGTWFDEIEANEREAASPHAIWRGDLDMAFYVALFLRGAEHSIRYQVPVRYF
jgi:hypothetical protein